MEEHPVAKVIRYERHKGRGTPAAYRGSAARPSGAEFLKVKSSRTRNLNNEWPSSALISTRSWAAGISERESSPAMAIGLQAATTEEMDVLLDENFMCLASEPSLVRRTTQTRATTKGTASRNRSSPIRIPTRNMGSTRAVEFRYGGENGGGELDDEEEEGEGMVPPHVIVDRRMNGRKTAFSVCTGNGRTLKGRDLRRVRNLVLTQTGFLEGRLVF
ncbi:uncharacterized protein LOC116265679 [Nymphaea colorata]|uniref:Uncharacterized protein n=1 Tax=Nymphaea colorata TaxID=210225 RepID=A0A5K0W9G3_9MAGN|nr:uncharacterized protein LOC116265679 [Nymphaea colorata]